MAKALRKRSLTTVSKTGVEVSQVYCRKCMETKPPKDFYMRTNEFLDSNGYMSICKQCISEMYVRTYGVEHSLERAIYSVCKTVDIIYDEGAVQGTITQLETQGKTHDDITVFGVYKTKIIPRTSLGKRSDGSGNDLTFHENTSVPEAVMNPAEFEDGNSIIDFWGDGFATEEYKFLEQEFNNFKRTHKADTYAEIVLLKEVCYKMLDIQKSRKEEKSVANGVKELQALMTSLAISPNLANAANAGKGTETFGQWIKDIETTTPAEWVKDKSIFKDVDNIEEYTEQNIIRPLRNYITGSRDFGSEEISKIFEGDTDGVEEE